LTLVAARLPATAREKPETPGSGRIALRVPEAAEAIGVSTDHFERHVLPKVKVIRTGRLRLVPVAEIERWASENAARLGER
jgi:hypothetical protein